MADYPQYVRDLVKAWAAGDDHAGRVIRYLSSTPEVREEMSDIPKLTKHVKVTAVHEGRAHALLIPSTVDHDGTVTITMQDAASAVLLIKDSIRESQDECAS